jgi:hypothetical protein
MTTYRVRTHPDAATPTGHEDLRLLDWIPGKPEATIQLRERLSTSSSSAHPCTAWTKPPGATPQQMYGHGNSRWNCL